jgi:hypothetical protein
MHPNRNAFVAILVIFGVLGLIGGLGLLKNGGQQQGNQPPNTQIPRWADPSRWRRATPPEENKKDGDPPHILVRWNSRGDTCVEPGTLGLEITTNLCDNRSRFGNSIKLAQEQAVMLTMQMNEPKARPKATLFRLGQERDTFYKACKPSLHYYCHVLTITSWRGDVKVIFRPGFSLPGLYEN